MVIWGTELAEDEQARRGLLDTILAAEQMRQAHDLLVLGAAAAGALSILAFALFRRPLWLAMLRGYLALTGARHRLAESVKADLESLRRQQGSR